MPPFRLFRITPQEVDPLEWTYFYEVVLFLGWNQCYLWDNPERVFTPTEVREVREVRFLSGGAPFSFWLVILGALSTGSLLSSFWSGPEIKLWKLGLIRQLTYFVAASSFGGTKSAQSCAHAFDTNIQKTNSQLFCQHWADCNLETFLLRWNLYDATKFVQSNHITWWLYYTFTQQ